MIVCGGRDLSTSLRLLPTCSKVVFDTPAAKAINSVLPYAQNFMLTKLTPDVLDAFKTCRLKLLTKFTVSSSSNLQVGVHWEGGRCNPVDCAAFLAINPDSVILHVRPERMEGMLSQRLFHELAWLFHPGDRPPSLNRDKLWLPSPQGDVQTLGSFLHTCYVCQLGGQPISGAFEEYDV